jgi:hypothetical protein
MAVARWPPASEPAKVQFLLPTARLDRGNDTDANDHDISRDQLVVLQQDCGDFVVPLNTLDGDAEPNIDAVCAMLHLVD